MKIVLCSDNHGNISQLKRILNDNQKADYYLHCGDSQMNDVDLRPFVSVKGNNDYGSYFPDFKVFEILNHRILMIHGNRYIFMNSFILLAKKARELACDMVFFGHTHIFFDDYVDGIRMINPGSCFYNRDGSAPSYVTIEMDETNIFAKKHDLD